ncbi:MAG: choice-of-anchor L domain-containing protein [Polyangiaceae bacterium]|nr:choice-of-anchor L domain-containing protein [Polyangiaceae bacterium]
MRRTLSFSLWVAPAALFLASAVACSPVNTGTGGQGTGGTTTGTAGSGGSSGSTSNGGSGGIGIGGGPTGTGTGGGITCTPGGPNDDVDGDGYTPAMGDCEDCDPNRNPNAIETPTDPGKEPYDEDCDNEIDEDDSVLCDNDLAVDDEDPFSAARAMELCKTSPDGVEWGLVNAEWILADGSPPPQGQLQAFHLGHGILSAFGYNVTTQKGVRMAALSSGTARQPTDPGYKDVQGFPKGYTCGHPVGFPKESPSCPGTITGTPNDSTGIRLTIQPPSNAKGFSFDFKFYTFEWPGYVCSTFNDFFVALLTPFPMGQTDGNIAFDKMGNPVSVNNAFIEVCGCDGNPPNPCSAGGKTFDCPLGDLELLGTGFGFDSCAFCQDHGATGWLRTTAPIEDAKNDIVLDLAVYDSGDGVLDTTTLLDNFKWIAKPGVTIGTDIVPE